MTTSAITLMPAGNPSAFTGPDGNNTWLVDGREPLLVDAGVGTNAHLDRIAAALDGRPLARVFVTHNHPDHAAGAPALVKRWPQVKVTEGAGADGREFMAGNSQARVVATPGHSADHACLWLPAERVLFAGDLMVKGGTVLIAASSGGNLRAYLDSLAMVRALEPSRVYPGHGEVIDDARALIDQYIAHRHAREVQVREARAAGAASPDAIVAVVYPDLDPALASAARETVLAHLQKLDEDERTQR